MANIPQKSPDPTEEALTAIREALATDQSEATRAAPPPARAISRKRQPPATADLFNEEPQPGSWDSDEPPAAPRRQ